MITDDYFNRDGIFLGKDDANSDYVRIIEQKTWDKIKMSDENGLESISHESGVENSMLHSMSNISIEASLSVYNHYNPTDLELTKDLGDNGSSGGAKFWAKRSNDKISVGISISIEGNNKNHISNHANEIKNIFSHEEKHYSDFKVLGFDNYKNMRGDVLELRAIKYQMSQPTFINTRNSFQKATIKYGEKNGMFFPNHNILIKTITPMIKPIK